MELNQEIDTQDPAVAKVLMALVVKGEKDPEFLIELHDNLRTVLSRVSRPWKRHDDGTWVRKAVVSGRTLVTVKNIGGSWEIRGVYLSEVRRVSGDTAHTLDKALCWADEHLISKGYNLPDPWEP